MMVLTFPNQNQTSNRTSADPFKPMVLLVVWFSLNVAFLAVTEPTKPGQVSSRRFVSSNLLAQFRPNSSAASGDDAFGTNSLLPSRLLSPRRIPAGKRYPLLVFLHGAGQRGSNNVHQLRGLPEQMAQPAWRWRFPCFLFAPQCPAGTRWSDWVDELECAIQELIDTHAIDRSRIYLTGLSMGGFGSWELAARRPDLFAAVVPICGGGDPSWANNLAEVRLWAVHGDADRVVPVESSRKMIQAVTEAGGSPRYTELPGVGHDSWIQTYRDPEGVLKWMFAQANDCQPSQVSPQ